jgi:hypothetical protein
MKGHVQHNLWSHMNLHCIFDMTALQLVLHLWKEVKTAAAEAVTNLLQPCYLGLPSLWLLIYQAVSHMGGWTLYFVLLVECWIDNNKLMVYDALPVWQELLTSPPAITLSLSAIMSTFTQKIFIYLGNHIGNSRLYHCHYCLKNIYTATTAMKK